MTNNFEHLLMITDRIKVIAVSGVLLASAFGAGAQDYGNNLGSFKMGDMTMTAYGDHADIAFVMMGAKRNGDKVTVSFQYANQLSQPLTDVVLSNKGDYAIEAIGPDGTKYEVAKIVIGDASGDGSLTTTLPSGQALRGSVDILGIPESATSLGKFVLRSTAMAPGETKPRDYTYLLENVSIMGAPTVTITAPPAPAAESKAEGSRSAIVNGKAQPGKSAGIFNPVANSLANENDSWIINRDGVGPVKLGINVKAMPGRVADLYNKVQWFGPDKGILYYDGAEAIKLTVANDKITGISVLSGKTHANVGGKMFMVGDSSAELCKRQGVTLNGDTATFNDIRFSIANGKITAISISRQL